MKIDILTIFPKMFDSPFAESIVKRAKQKSKVDIHIHDLRKWTTDTYKTIDDKPFGGGAGMVMKIEPIYNALEDIDPDHISHRILFTATGARIMQQKMRELSGREKLLLICGHYEEIDYRVHEHLVDERLSLGDFVLTGGEVPAMALVEGVVRLLPGVLGNDESIADESFTESSDGLYLEYPQYTRPEVFTTNEGKKLEVPKVLLSGDHKEIRRWREERKLKVENGELKV